MGMSATAAAILTGTFTLLAYVVSSVLAGRREQRTFAREREERRRGELVETYVHALASVYLVVFTSVPGQYLALQERMSLANSQMQLLAPPDTAKQFFHAANSINSHVGRLRPDMCMPIDIGAAAQVLIDHRPEMDKLRALMKRDVGVEASGL